MFHFPCKPWRAVTAPSLLLATVLPFCVSCQSKGYVPRADDPYAEYIPRTKEEEEYYRDVLSGDWKNQPNLLGYFGLGKNQVSTTPPPHWTMQPPAGAKTMEEIRADHYEKQALERQAKSGKMALPNGQVYKTADVANPTPPDTVKNSNRAAVPDSAEGRETDSSDTQRTKENKHFFEKWTRFQPHSESRLSAGNESYHSDDPDFVELNRAMVIRGQALTDELGPRTGSGITSTAEAVKVPLKIYPQTADRWRHVNGLLVTDDVPKDLPDDEYVVVGGDAGGEAFTLPNWDVHNLEADETIAHFDTIRGEIKVEPSNRFVIYMPRFGTIRQVVGPKSNSQNTRLTMVGQEVAPVENHRSEGVDFRSQEEKTSSTRGELQISNLRANQPGGELTGEEGLIEESQKVLIASANSLLREDTVSDQNRIELTQGAAAATAWGKTQGVAVQIDKVSAQGNVTLQGAATIYSIKNDTKTSQLRLFKSASKSEAAPGELIEFTLRYENVGGEVIGNVTILDSLSARLQYVDDSAISSKAADLLVKNNEKGSLLLRWEITDPLEPGDFGVITFLCKVR
ncbi:MAG: hypothetical protein ACOX6D_10470 [Thermoguttaceae bacterium]|jgi:uncharacterized repeat protein (TIGR01451 family)